MKARIVDSVLAFYHSSSIRYIVFVFFTLSALAGVALAAAAFSLRLTGQQGAALEAQNLAIAEQNRALVEQAARSLEICLADMVRLSDAASDLHAANGMGAGVGSGSGSGSSTGLGSGAGLGAGSPPALVEQYALLCEANGRYVMSIALFDADGRMVAAASPSELNGGVDVSDEPWFAKAIEQPGSAHLSAPGALSIFANPEHQSSGAGDGEGYEGNSAGGGAGGSSGSNAGGSTSGGEGEWAITLSRAVEIAEPTNYIDPANPANPANPATSANPANSTNSANPDNPATPATPADNANPAERAMVTEIAEFIDTSEFVDFTDIAEFTASADAAPARLGVLLVALRLESVFEPFSDIKLANGGYVYIIDGDGTAIYHPNSLSPESSPVEDYSMALAENPDGEYSIGDGKDARTAVIRSTGFAGWSVVGVTPMRAATFDNLQNFLFLLAIAFVCLLAIAVVNYVLSGKLTDPIKQLELSVRQVELGLASSEIFTGGSYEIRQLGRSIKQMFDLTRKLADDIVEENTQKQKSELNALQAQINPHFLYNTLDSLVWMIEKGNPEDALKIVSALARLFRLSLSKGMNIITVADELEHARNYLMIQKMRYKNKFNYEIEADDEALVLGSIKLVLQPIVENAIYHGMDFMADGEGVIRITAKLVDGSLRLSVEDNGLGMPPSLVEQLQMQCVSAAPAAPIDSKGSGIGIRNVHERITLYFGEGYGVMIESEPDVGTCVSMLMPAVPYEKMEEWA